MKRILLALIPLLIFCSFNLKRNLKGTWEYSGGIYNGKPGAASKGYRLQRIYDADHYEAVFIDSTAKPVTYERGDYQLKQDTCLETQTYSLQPSQVNGVTMHYHYQVKNDTLTFTGILPNGTHVQEYWKKLK